MSTAAKSSSPIAADVQQHLRGWLKEMAAVRRASSHSVQAYLHDVSGFLAFDCLLFLRVFPVHAVCCVSVVLPLTVSIKARLAPAITA